MKLDRLEAFFSASPSAKLMRSPHAAHIIYFLFRQFKELGNITWPHSRLQQQLSDFLDVIHAADPETDRFGQQYKDYMAKTGRFFPRISVSKEAK